MKPLRRVGVFVDLIGSYGRGIFMGLRRYAEEVGNWQCRLPSTWPVGNDVDISTWHVDGWIGYSNEYKLGALMQRSPKPLVCVSTAEARPGGGPAVAADNRAIARMAFDYLLERGHTQFAFVGHDSAFSAQRQAGFVEAVEAFKRQCRVFPVYRYTPASDVELTAWLLALPKPIGLLTDNDSVGAIVLNLCREAGIAVPQQIAVLSVDDDELLCTGRFPTMSSVRLDTARIGYEAASVLDRMLNNEPPPSKPLLIPPLRVITRQSTDTLAFADEEVRRAVMFIRSRVSQPTSVADVIRNAAVSARPLEQRFSRQLGCTILQYIHKMHVEQALIMLADTDLPIDQVARASGFTSATRLGIVLRRFTGRTPSQYRREAQAHRSWLEPGGGAA